MVTSIQVSLIRVNTCEVRCCFSDCGELKMIEKHKWETKKRNVVVNMS